MVLNGYFCRFQEGKTNTTLLPSHTMPLAEYVIVTSHWSIVEWPAVAHYHLSPSLLQMALHRLFQLSFVLRSAVSLTLRRNLGLSAVLFQRAKELDPVQKLFLDKIRDYDTKSKWVDLQQPHHCVTYWSFKLDSLVKGSTKKSLESQTQSENKTSQYWRIFIEKKNLLPVNFFCMDPNKICFNTECGPSKV